MCQEGWRRIALALTWNAVEQSNASRRVEKDSPFGIDMRCCRAVQCVKKGGKG